MFMRNTAALIAIIPLALGAVSIAAEEMEIDATIQEINDAPRSLTVQNEATGETQTFRIDDDTEIVFDRNLDNGAAALRSGFDDLHEGQQVKLRFDDKVMDDDWVIVHFITIS